MELGGEKNPDRSDIDEQAAEVHGNEDSRVERDRDAAKNTERPAGDWTVAPDPVEPNKPGQQIEDPRKDTGPGAV